MHLPASRAQYEIIPEQNESTVDSNSRSSINAILVTLGIFVLGSSALAADYRVDFGAETSAGKDAGTLNCLFDKICGTKLESLGLRVSVYMSRREPERASINLYGGDPSCCFFAGAADSMAINSLQPLSRVPFFEGAGARGGLFIENQRAGTLYLRFNFFRDRI